MAINYEKIRIVCNPNIRLQRCQIYYLIFVEHLGRCMYGGLYEPEMLIAIIMDSVKK